MFKLSRRTQTDERRVELCKSYTYYPHKKGGKLLNCVAEGDVATAQLLLSEGADPNSAYANGASALIQATLNGHTGVAWALVRAGADINTKDNYGRTALMYSIVFDQAGIFDSLVSESVHLDSVDNKRFSALSMAAMLDHPFYSRNILEAGAKASRFSEFLLAIARGDHEKVASCISEPWLEQPDFPGAFTPLMLASRHNNVQILEVLADAGSEIDYQQDGDGGTALMWAAAFGNAPVVDTLLLRGADASLKDNHGDSAISLAQRFKHSEAERLLCARKQVGSVGE